MITGLYRIPARDGHPEDVRVDNDGIEHSMFERLYRTRGYKPHVADLPWQDEYFAQKAAGSGGGTA